MQLSETCQWCASAHARMAQFNIKSQGSVPMPPVTWVLITVGSVWEVPASLANTTLPAPLLLRSKCNINQCRAVKEVSPMLYLSKWLYELLLVQTSAQQLGSTTVGSKYTWILNTRNGHLRTHMHNASWKQRSHVLLYLSSIYVHTVHLYLPLCSCLGKHIQIAQGFFSFKHDSLEMPGRSRVTSASIARARCHCPKVSMTRATNGASPLSSARRQLLEQLRKRFRPEAASCLTCHVS